jgi:hypothetical protein
MQHHLVYDLQGNNSLPKKLINRVIVFLDISLASKYFWNKTREYLKEKINEGIDEFKSGHQPRNNLVKVENGDLLADSHNIVVSPSPYPTHLCWISAIEDDCWQLG